MFVVVFMGSTLMTWNASNAGAALSCDPCAAGEHQDEEGQSICKRCGIGNLTA